MPLQESDLLDLPEAPDFISDTPQLSMDQLIALAEKMLPYSNSQRYSKPEPPFVGEAFTLL